MVPIALTSIGDAKVAIKRVSALLTAEEIEGDYPIDRTSTMAVRLDGDFTWESSSPPDSSTNPKSKSNFKAPSDEKDGVPPTPFTLMDLCIEVPKGKFVAVVGKVGSGKSSLLQAMVGEMRKTRGDVVFGGSVAYVAQSPWIQVSRDHLPFRFWVGELTFLFFFFSLLCGVIEHVTTAEHSFRPQR